MPKAKEGSITFHSLHLKNLITGEVKSYRDVPVAFDRRNIYVQHPDFKYQIKVGKAAGVDSTSVLFSLAVRGYDDREFHFVDPYDRNRQYDAFVRCVQACFDRARREAEDEDDDLNARGGPSLAASTLGGRRPVFAQKRQPRKFGTAAVTGAAALRTGRIIMAGSAGGAYSGGSVRLKVAATSSQQQQQNRYKQETFSDDDDDDEEEEEAQANEAGTKPKSAHVTSDPAERTAPDRSEEAEEANEEHGRSEDEEELSEQDLEAKMKPTRKPDPKPNRTKRIGKRLVKATKESDGPDDESSSDDGDFLCRPASLTTPAVQRVVSPSTLKTAKDDGVEEEDEEEDPLDKNQRTITSFFQARTERGENAALQPTSTARAKANTSTPSPATTPSRLSASAIRIVKSSNSKIRNETFLQTSPMRSPSLEARRQRLFGKGARSSIARPRNPMDVLDRADEAAGSFRAANPSPSHLHPPRTVKRPRLNPQSRFRPLDLEGSDRGRVPFSPLPESKEDDVVEDRPVSRFRGIQNLGNTCYCASTLQMLCSAFRFIEAIQERGGRLTRSLAHLSKALQLDMPSNAPVDPREVKEAMDATTDRFAGYEQRDAHEFMGELVDRIHEELEEEQKHIPADDRHKTERLPTDDFRMTVHKVLKCESCGYERTMSELYRYLSIDIADGENSTTPVNNGKPSVANSLSHYFQPDLREIKCEKCSHGSHATESLFVSERPRYLLLHLKRFVWVKKELAAPPSEENLPPNVAEPPPEFVFRKNKAAVSIPESLTLDPFCKEAYELQPHSPSKYKLKSIVHHIGQRPFSGHYIAHAIRPRKDDRAEDDKQPKRTGQDPSTLNVERPLQSLKDPPDHTTATSEPEPLKAPLDPYQWVAFDDTYSAIVDLEEILKSPSRQSTAYMLLYAMEDEGASIVDGVKRSSA